MDAAMFFEILFMGLLGAVMVGIVGVSIAVIRGLFKGQS